METDGNTMETLFNKGPAISFIKVFHCRFFTKDHMKFFRIVYIKNTCEWLLLLYIVLPHLLMWSEIFFAAKLVISWGQSIFSKVETTTFKI